MAGSQIQNLDDRELAKFTQMARHWWDPDGPLGALHDINPLRVAYVAGRSPLAGRRVLDVGCGGGLLAEALAAGGARVTGIDAAAASLKAAEAHRRSGTLDIRYVKATAEVFADRHPGAWDVVACMELLEHVPDPASVIAACARLARPGGHIFFATVNRTVPAYLLVILAAEYLLGIVGRGTHRWRNFVRPAELSAWAAAAGLRRRDLSGVRYIPLLRRCRLTRSTSMNYLMHFQRPPEPDGGTA